MSVWESLLAALNPVAVGGSTALVDGLLLLLFALALVQELAHLSRALSLRSAATLMRQRPALRGLAQVEPLVAPVVTAVPPLAGPMQAVVASAVLWGERVRAERGAASLLQLDDLRATGGVVLLPDGLLRAMPSLLVTLGALGVLLGLAPALGDQTQALSALTLSFRCAVWGLGCGVLLSAVNNLSVGMAEGALRSLVASLDQQLPPLGDAAAMRALTLAEEAQALARSESVRREESEAAALKVAVEHARIARIAEERLLRLHEGLTLQQQDQARRQEALLTAVESTRQAMLALGPAVEGALERGMNVQLGPALAELSRQQSLSAQSAREHLNNIAANQLASADRMSARLIEGIDQGLLAPLRQVNEALTAASETQAQGLLAWQDSAQGLVQAVESLRAASGSIENSTERLERAAAPMGAAAAQFQGASTALAELLPGLEGISTAAQRAREALDTSASSLDRSAAAHQSSADLMYNTLVDLKEGLGSWRQLSDTLGGVVAELRVAGAGLSLFGDRLQEVAGPTADAARAFSQASVALDRSLPRLGDLADSQERARDAFEASADRLARSGAGWADAARAAEQAITGLSEVYNNSAEQFGTRLDATLGRKLEQAGLRLEAITRHQADTLRGWQEHLDAVGRALAELRAASGSVSALCAALGQATEPAAEAGEGFRVAARELGVMLTRASDAQRGYERLASGLQAAAVEMERSSTVWSGAGGDLSGAVAELREALVLQREGAEMARAALAEAGVLSTALPPASAGLQAAAGELRAAASQTVGLMQGMSGAAEALSSQAAQWERLGAELRTLQGAMGEGLDTFTSRLPIVVDETLVQFDGVLGEGVARLGSSVERLREALDELHERLESLMPPARRP